MASARTAGNRLRPGRPAPYPKSANSPGADAPFQILQDVIGSPGRESYEHDIKRENLKTTERSLRVPLSEFLSAGNRANQNIPTYVGHDEDDVMNQILCDTLGAAAPTVRGNKRKLDQEPEKEDDNADANAGCEKKLRPSSAFEQEQEVASNNSNTPEPDKSSSGSPTSSKHQGSMKASSETSGLRLANPHEEQGTEFFWPYLPPQEVEEAAVRQAAARGMRRRKGNCSKPASDRKMALPATDGVLQILHQLAQNAFAGSYDSGPPPTTMEPQPDAPGFGGWVVSPESSPGGTLYPVSNEEYAYNHLGELGPLADVFVKCEQPQISFP